MDGILKRSLLWLRLSEYDSRQPKSTSAPADRPDSATAKEADSAPANKSGFAPVNKPDSAPANEPNLAPSQASPSATETSAALPLHHPRPPTIDHPSEACLDLPFLQPPPPSPSHRSPAGTSPPPEEPNPTEPVNVRPGRAPLTPAQAALVPFTYQPLPQFRWRAPDMPTLASFPKPRFVDGGCLCGVNRYRVTFPLEHDFVAAVSSVAPAA